MTTKFEKKPMLHESVGPTSSNPSRLLSIVIPVYNEEDAIGQFIAALHPALIEARNVLGLESRTEIVFVDDGSGDRTVERICDQSLEDCSIRVVKLSRNFGKDAALAAGLSHVRGDAVVPMDVDLQDPPTLLPEMVAAWMDGYKVVNAVRVDRNADGWLKRTSAAAFYKLYNRLASHPVEPDVGDFRLLDRQVVDTLNQMPERIRFMKGLFSWVGFSQARVEYKRDARVVGDSKWRFWQLWNFALDGIAGSSTLPLRVWTYIGGGLAILALLFATLLVVRTLIFGNETPGYASLMTVILTLGAANLIAIGIVGEYVGRISFEVRQRPLYVVEELIDVHLDG